MEVSAGGVEEFATLASGQGGERHGGEGGAVGGGANVADPAGRFAGCPERGGDDADRVHPGGLALVVRGADRGVALDVLHGPHAGTGGAEDIGHGLVALEIHEVVVPVIRAAVLPGYQPELAGGGGGARRRRRRRFDVGLEARGDDRRGPGGDAFGHAVVEVETAAAGAGHLLVGDHAVGDEGGEVFVPAEPALALGVQVHHR